MSTPAPSDMRTCANTNCSTKVFLIKKMNWYRVNPKLQSWASALEQDLHLGGTHVCSTCYKRMRRLSKDVLQKRAAVDALSPLSSGVVQGGKYIRGLPNDGRVKVSDLFMSSSKRPKPSPAPTTPTNLPPHLPPPLFHHTPDRRSSLSPQTLLNQSSPFMAMGQPFSSPLPSRAPPTRRSSMPAVANTATKVSTAHGWTTPKATRAHHGATTFVMSAARGATLPPAPVSSSSSNKAHAATAASSDVDMPPPPPPLASRAPPPAPPLESSASSSAPPPAPPLESSASSSAPPPAQPLASSATPPPSAAVGTLPPPLQSLQPIPRSTSSSSSVPTPANSPRGDTVDAQTPSLPAGASEKRVVDAMGLPLPFKSPVDSGEFFLPRTLPATPSDSRARARRLFVAPPEQSRCALDGEGLCTNQLQECSEGDIKPFKKYCEIMGYNAKTLSSTSMLCSQHYGHITRFTASKRCVHLEKLVFPASIDRVFSFQEPHPLFDEACLLCQFCTLGLRDMSYLQHRLDEQKALLEEKKEDISISIAIQRIKLYLDYVTKLVRGEDVRPLMVAEIQGELKRLKRELQHTGEKRKETLNSNYNKVFISNLKSLCLMSRSGELVGRMDASDTIVAPRYVPLPFLLVSMAKASHREASQLHEQNERLTRDVHSSKSWTERETGIALNTLVNKAYEHFKKCKFDDADYLSCRYDTADKYMVSELPLFRVLYTALADCVTNEDEAKNLHLEVFDMVTTLVFSRSKGAHRHPFHVLKTLIVLYSPRQDVARVLNRLGNIASRDVVLSNEKALIKSGKNWKSARELVLKYMCFSSTDNNSHLRHWASRAKDGSTILHTITAQLTGGHFEIMLPAWERRIVFNNLLRQFDEAKSEEKIDPVKINRLRASALEVEAEIEEADAKHDEELSFLHMDALPDLDHPTLAHTRREELVDPPPKDTPLRESILSGPNSAANQEDAQCKMLKVALTFLKAVLSKDFDTNARAAFGECFGFLKPENKSKVVFLPIVPGSGHDKVAIKESVKTIMEKMEVGRGGARDILVTGDQLTYDILLDLQSQDSSLDAVMVFPGDDHAIHVASMCLYKIYGNHMLKPMAARIKFDFNRAAAGKMPWVRAWDFFAKTVISILCTFAVKYFSEKTGKSQDEIMAQPPPEVFEKIQEAFDSPHVLLEWIRSDSARSENLEFFVSFCLKHALALILLRVSLRHGIWPGRVEAWRMLFRLYCGDNRPNYMPLAADHLARMQSMPKQILNSLMHGNFTISISGHELRLISLDDGHERIINRTYKRVARNPTESALEHLSQIIGYRAEAEDTYVSQFFSTAAPSKTERDLTEDIRVLINSLRKETFLFSGAELTYKDLGNPFTGELVGPKQRDSILNWESTAEERANEMATYTQKKLAGIDMDKLSFDSIKWFQLEGKKKKPRIPAHMKDIMEASRFQSAKFDLLRQSGTDLDVNDPASVQRFLDEVKDVVLIAQSSPMPLSLFTSGGLPLLPTDKSLYKKVFNITQYVTRAELRAQPIEAAASRSCSRNSAVNEEPPKVPTKSTALIIDGFALLHEFQNLTATAFLENFFEVFSKRLSSYLRKFRCSAAYLVWDRPEIVLQQGIKTFTQDKRGSGYDAEKEKPVTGIEFFEGVDKLLGNHGKRSVVKAISFFLRERFCVPYTSQVLFISGHQLYEDGSPLNDCTLAIWEDKYKIEEKLQCRHGEADHSVFYFATQTPAETVIIRASDTDILFYAAFLFDTHNVLKGKHLYVLGKAKRGVDAFLDIRAFVAHLLKTFKLSPALVLVLYFKTGCDYSGKFLNLSKAFYTKTFLANRAFVEEVESLVRFLNGKWVVSPDASKRLEIACYVKKHSAHFSKKTVQALFNVCDRSVDKLFAYVRKRELVVFMANEREAMPSKTASHLQLVVRPTTLMNLTASSVFSDPLELKHPESGWGKNEKGQVGPVPDDPERIAAIRKRNAATKVKVKPCGCKSKCTRGNCGCRQAHKPCSKQLCVCELDGCGNPHSFAPFYCTKKKAGKFLCPKHPLYTRPGARSEPDADSMVDE